METIVNENSEVVTSQAADLDSASPTPISVVHVSIPNQPVQVQSVIQPAPSSVIQATGQTLQTIQVTTVGSDGDGDDDVEGKKRREILARRPSYRRILNELSSDAPTTITVSKIEEESTNGSQTSQESQEGNEAATNLTSHTLTSVAGTVQYQQSTGETVTVVPAGAIQIAAHGDGTTQGLQTLTMTNVNAANTTPSAATIVQYAQGPDGQLFIPSLAGNVQTYQIQTTPTTLPQGVVMATTGSALASPQQLSEEAARKRELRLLKNREAAKECRRKKKEYVKCLENRVAVLENQNKALIEELKSLKELYCQKEAVGQ